MTPADLYKHVDEAVMTPEERVERCTRQRGHVTTHPHVRSSMVGLEVTEVVRLAEVVVRLARHDAVDHARRVLQTTPAWLCVRKTCQHAIPATDKHDRWSLVINVMLSITIIICCHDSRWDNTNCDAISLLLLLLLLLL